MHPKPAYLNIWEYVTQFTEMCVCVCVRKREIEREREREKERVFMKQWYRANAAIVLKLWGRRLCLVLFTSTAIKGPPQFIVAKGYTF